MSEISFNIYHFCYLEQIWFKPTIYLHSKRARATADFILNTMYVTVKEPGGNTRPPVGKVTDDQLLLIHHIYIPIKTFIRHASLNIRYGGNCLFYVFTTYVVASVLICLLIDKIKSSFKVLNRWTA